MAAPPLPRPPKAQSDGGDGSFSLFLDTDLGTRLAMLVAPDTTFRRLKSQVAAEHAMAFPDLGPVAVKSFQVHRKGALYHLSESMTVTSAFTRVKGGCFLHVKMEEAAVAMRCCQGTPEIDGRRSSEGGFHIEKHDKELPAAAQEVANDGVTHGPGGGDATAVLNNVHAHDALLDDVLLPPSSQLDTETKNEAEGLASDVDIDKSSKQAIISHVVEADAKENFLHGDRDHDGYGDVSDNKQIRIEEDMLGQVHDVDDISLGKERKKAKMTDYVHMPATNPRITNESDTMDTKKLIRAPLETNPIHGELSNTFGKEVNDNVPEDSLRIENPSTVGKKKKRKKCQLAHSEAISGQETAKVPTEAMGLSKSGADAYEVDLINRDGSKARSSVLLLLSEPNDESQGGKQVQFVNNAQAPTDLTSEQGNFDHVHNGDRKSSIGDATNSTAEVPASGENIAEGSNGPWDGGEKHEETKQHVFNDGSHDGDVAETGNMKKGGKNIDALEERPTNDHISKEKKRKKVKKVNSVGMASMDTAGDKEILGHTEDAQKSEKFYTEREILHGLSVGPISNNAQQGDSNAIENLNGRGKKKKKRKCHSESLMSVNPNQDQTKSSEHVMNGSLIQDTNSAPVDAKQTTQGSVGATVSDNKFGESLDIAAANMIDEVLADLKSGDSLSKELSEDLLTGQISLDINPNALELPASIDNEVGNHAALPPKYPEAIHSDAPARSPSHKKPKRKQLKVLPTMIDSSHHSRGMPEEDADTKLIESETSRFPGKANDLKDIFTGDDVVQDYDKTKSTKRQRKKVKKVPTDNDKTTQSLDEQVNQVAREDMEGANAAIEADLVQAGSVINTPMETVAKLQQKGKNDSKTWAPKRQETNHFTHAAQDSQDENAIGITGTHDNENASGYPTESPLIQKDAATRKSSGPDARKKRKKRLKNVLQSQDSAMEHNPSSDLLHGSAEKGLVSPKISADAAEPNHCIVAPPASDKITFIDHFSLGEMNDRLVSAENIQKNEDEIMEANIEKNNTGSTEPNGLLESLPPAEKTSLTDHFGTNEVVVPSAKAENMNREYDNVNSGKEKRKRKRKPNSEGLATDKENLDGDHQSASIGTQYSLHSVVQKGRMGQDNGNGNNNKVTQNVSMMQQEPEDAAFDRTVEKKLHRGDVDSQNNLPINEDNANTSKELRKSTSQKKPHNLVKSFAMSPVPAASSDSKEGTPQIANRFRLAVRKVPKKRSEQANAKFKKESRKVGLGAIFNDAISEESDDAMDNMGEKAALETSSDNSSASANSGISSTAYDESDEPDDDGTLSLSQKSLRGLHIGSILRGSSSYKKVKQKQAELLDDDTEVPDSQPADGLWG